MAIKIQGETVIYDDETVRVASGTTAERPTPATGMLRFNTTDTTFEGYDGTAWGPLGGGADEFARTLAALSLGITSTAQTFTDTITFNQPTNHTSGTASLPGITFSGDLDTGIYRPTTNQLGFSTNGSNRVFIGDTGNIGIGTITPSTLLDVNGSVTLTGNLISNSAKIDTISSRPLVANNTWTTVFTFTSVGTRDVGVWYVTFHNDQTTLSAGADLYGSFSIHRGNDVNSSYQIAEHFLSANAEVQMNSNTLEFKRTDGAGGTPQFRFYILKLGIASTTTTGP